MSTLALIEKKSLAAAEVFATPDNLTALIKGIRAEVVTETPDLSTAASRQRIASLAYKVARSKTTLDDLGKQLVSEWKTKSAAVDKERKRVRDELDALRDEVRKPLTDWEAEQASIAAEAARIEAERIAAEKAEAAEKAKREADQKEADRVANQNHRDSVESALVAELTGFGIENAQAVVDALKKSSLVSIKY